MKTPSGVIFALSCMVLADAIHWDYIDDENGPGHWAELFPEGCSGRFQSPIDIHPEKTIYDPTLKDFVVFYDPPSPGSKFILHNNGHTLQVNTEGDFFVSNGGLPNLFRTSQFHFHWGHESLHGSEHTVDGHAAPIELHIVNWNADKYDSIAEAAIQPDGLAVLGVLFEVSDEDNEKLNLIVDVLMKVQDPDWDNRVELPALSMREFLPALPERYFRYKGSLTTPGCFESVFWTVFAEKLPISRRQLHVFRQTLKSGHHHRRRRSPRNRRQRVLDNVLGELGIENNKMEKLRFKRQLVNKHANDTRHAHEQHGKDEDTDPDEGHEPLGSHGNSHADAEEAHATEVHEEEEEERDFLVDNYRPVQALHGRTVYRSFPFLEDPLPVDHSVWDDKQREVKHLVRKLCPLLEYFSQEHHELP